jgi:hypothetical protein
MIEYRPMRPMYGHARDLQMMKTPDIWPMWPRLPLKKRNLETGQVDVGLIMAVEGMLTTVWHVTMFETVTPDVTPHMVYESYEAITDDGWIVD